MQIVPINWAYIGSPDCLWRGSTGALLGHITFTIKSTGNPDEYMVSTDFKEIENALCFGALNAQQTAQKLLDSYAFTLSIF